MGGFYYQRSKTTRKEVLSGSNGTQAFKATLNPSGYIQEYVLPQSVMIHWPQCLTLALPPLPPKCCNFPFIGLITVHGAVLTG